MLPLLEGIRVIDLTQLFTLAPSKLADLGADVIKVEQAPHGDYMRDLPPIVEGLGVGLPYLMLNRNKRSLCLNLKSEEGIEVVRRLLRTADVVVEISRPGALARLGLDFDSVKEVKHDIIYCSISGYGQSGPYRDLPSHGLNIDAAAGMLKIERGPDGRPEIARRSGMGAEEGGLHAALGIAAALVQRTRTGQGQFLDISCWDGAIAYNLGLAVALNCPPETDFTDLLEPGGFGPRYDVYGTEDNKVILLAPIEKRFWVSFCKVIGRDDWLERGKWEGAMDFGNDDPDLRDDIQKIMSTRTAEEWMTDFRSGNVPASPVVDVDELRDNPHMRERHIVVRSEGRDSSVQYIRPPIQIPEAEFSIVHPPPSVGEHSRVVLTELGYAASELERLVGAGIVLAAPEHGRSG